MRLRKLVLFLVLILVFLSQSIIIAPEVRADVPRPSWAGGSGEGSSEPVTERVLTSFPASFNGMLMMVALTACPSSCDNPVPVSAAFSYADDSKVNLQKAFVINSIFSPQRPRTELWWVSHNSSVTWRNTTVTVASPAMLAVETVTYNNTDPDTPFGTMKSLVGTFRPQSFAFYFTMNLASSTAFLLSMDTIDTLIGGVQIDTPPQDIARLGWVGQDVNITGVSEFFHGFLTSDISQTTQFNMGGTEPFNYIIYAIELRADDGINTPPPGPPGGGEHPGGGGGIGDGGDVVVVYPDATPFDWILQKPTCSNIRLQDTRPQAANAVLYLWDFGDGNSTQTGAGQVNHTYAIEGTYGVTVTVQDKSGSIQFFTGTVNTVGTSCSFTMFVEDVRILLVATALIAVAGAIIAFVIERKNIFRKFAYAAVVSFIVLVVFVVL